MKIFKAYHHYHEIKGKDVIIPIEDIQVPDDVFIKYNDVNIVGFENVVREAGYNIKRVIEENTGVIKK